MIANPNYQLLVTGADLVTYSTSMDASFKSIKGANMGKVLIIDEDDNSNATIADIKRFSLYQYALNDKGKEVLIKHGGPLPIIVSKIREKTFKKYSPGVPQYWQLTLDTSFAGCCENYSVRFGLYNDAIQKTMFPSELVETYSVENTCCGKGCSENDPYDYINVLFRIWADVATRNIDSEHYVTAYLVDENKEVIADVDGDIKYGNISTNIRNFHNGFVTYDDNGTPGTASVSDFINTILLNGYSDKLMLVFAIAEEPKNQYGQMNLEYDVIRNTVARVTLNGGFECATGVDKISNDNGGNAAKINIGKAGETGTAVNVFAYSVGSGYDVRQMEYGDSLHTLNSPYTLSDITYSENGMKSRAISDEYDLLTIEYQQPSDGVTRVEHHPWGTTIALDATTTPETSAETNWTAFINLIGL